MADSKYESDSSPRSSARPRRGATVRTFRALMLLGLVLIGLHFLWSKAAQRKLGAVVERYQQQGEPMLPADFDQPAVQDEGNAVVDLRAAAAAINQTDERYKAWEEQPEEPTLPLTDKEAALLAAAVEANRAALDKLDAAPAKSGIDWGITPRTPVVMCLLPDLNTQRGLTRLLALDALHAHQTGDDAGAVRRLRQVLFIGRAVDRQPFLVSHLVSIGLGGIASERAAQIASTLKVAADPTGAAAATAGATGAAGVPAAGPATPLQVKQLIDDLLAFDADNAGLAKALRGERMMELDSVNAVLGGKISADLLAGVVANNRGGSIALAAGEVSRYALRPAIVGDARLMIGFMTRTIAAVDAADWPSCQARLPAFPKQVEEHRFLHPMAAILLPSPDGPIRQHYRDLTSRRLAATALAVRLYAAGHEGRLPAGLVELTPQYLPRVPGDPMATGRPILYLNGDGLAAAHAGDPVVYSTGDNGLDDGGSDQLLPAKKSRARLSPWDRLDLVVHLKQQPRVPAP